MVVKGNAIYHCGKAIDAVYKGALLVWEAIRSCFGRGYWDDEKPWSDDDAWREESADGERI